MTGDDALLFNVPDALTQIAAWEPRIEGWVEHLEYADDGRSTATPSGPLCGVPFGVKDIIDVKGFPTRYGSAAFEDAPVAFQDASVVAALRAAGAIPVGKTRTTEFAFVDPTISRNPFDPGRTPGGSSSGSGAAVGAGVVPFALGTQTAGSLIRPACYCGAFAYKPSLGALPTTGVSPLSSTFDQVGVIATSSAWLQVVFSVLAQAFSIDGHGAATGPSAGTVPKRIAMIHPPEQTPDAEMIEAMAATIRRLEEGGASVTEMPSPVSFRELLDAHRVIMLFEAARDLLAFVGDRRHLLQAKLSAGLAEGERIPETTYLAAVDTMQLARKTLWAETSAYDLLLAYPVSGAAPIGLTTTGDQSYLSPWTALGGPLLTMPAAIDSKGMPLGVMFAAPPGQDGALVQCSSSLQSLLGTIGRPRL